MLERKRNGRFLAARCPINNQTRTMHPEHHGVDPANHFTMNGTDIILKLLFQNYNQANVLQNVAHRVSADSRSYHAYRSPRTLLISVISGSPAGNSTGANCRTGAYISDAGSLACNSDGEPSLRDTLHMTGPSALSASLARLRLITPYSRVPSAGRTSTPQEGPMLIPTGFPREALEVVP